MMQAFRNAAKPVVFLITFTFLAWMIVDLSGITGSGGIFSRTSVGSINGEKVDTRVYQNAVQNAISQRQQQTGTALGIQDIQTIRDQVWDQFIQATVLNSEVEKHRLTASPEEITAYIRQVPPQELQAGPEFQTEGKFDFSKYQRWLASPVGQQYVPLLESNAREQILQNKLLSAITADVYLSDPALWERYQDQHAEVKVSLTAIIGRNAMPDSAVTVAPAEVEAYYKAHPEEFARPRTAWMSFLAVPRKLDASDTAAALAKITQIREELVKGADFADVARRESSDTVSARKGGDLGTFGKGQMTPNFEKAAFSLPLNTLSPVVETPFGYHLLEVTRRTKDSVTARHILVPIELAGAHRDRVDSMTDQLEREAAERLDPAALDSAAKSLKLPIGQTGGVQQGSGVLLGRYVIPDAGVWAFQAKLGETSPIIDGEVASYVFRLDSIQEAGTPPLDAIRDGVTARVREQKKDAQARKLADELVARVRAGASLADASKAMKLPNQEFPPFTRINPPITDPVFVGAAFGLPDGALSAPIVTDHGIYVLKVLQKISADSAQFVKEKNEFMAQSYRMARQDRVRQYFAALRDKAVIKDRRAEIFTTNAQAEASAPAQTTSR